MTTQICDPLDCGGGRAPVKYNVPCCAAYTGTAECVTSASYLPCFKQLAQSTIYSSMAEPTSSPDASATSDYSAASSPTEAASSEDDQPVPTGQTSGSPTTVDGPATTQPPTNALKPSKGLVGTGTTAVTGGSGNATLSSAPAPSPTPSQEGVAGIVRVDALVAVAGALIALV